MQNTDLLTVIFIVGLILLGAIGSLTKYSGKQRRRNPSSYKPRYGSYEDRLTGFPYELQQHFLTPAELRFYGVLRRVVGNRAAICPKVRIGDVFWVNVQDKRTLIGYSNKVNRKHVDFLICDFDTMRPLMGIELDDSSHQREDRQERDAFVDGVFNAAKVPLLHIPVQHTYSATELNAQLSPYLEISAPAPTPQTTAPKSSKPVCPQCGGAMTLRTAQSGPKAGQQFWGCVNYPTCRGVLRVQTTS
ncbi:MAG: DUF2726 domain-containing protein [Anaerolineae bacterium]